MKRVDPQLPRPLAVDTGGLARMLSVSSSFVRKLDLSGRIPRGVQLGRKRLWSVEEVTEWMRAGGPAREQWEARGRAKR